MLYRKSHKHKFVHLPGKREVEDVVGDVSDELTLSDSHQFENAS